MASGRLRINFLRERLTKYMARINIEEAWWQESRRNKLGKLLEGIPFTPNDLVESVMVRAWRGAQEYWQKGELVPGRVFMSFLAADAILLSDLARIHTGPEPDSPIISRPSILRFIERVPNDVRTNSNEIQTAIERYLTEAERNWIYVNGSESSFKWAVDARRQRVEAGKKSAQKRLELYGSAQPIPNGARTEPERPFERDSNAPNETERSVSVSGSGFGSSSVSGSVSRSGSKKKNAGIRLDYPHEFDAFWKLYGIKGDKKKSYEIWQDLKLTPAELTNLNIATSNYLKANPDRQFRKDGENFLRTDWRVWVEPTSEMLNLKRIYSNGASLPFKTKNQIVDEQNDQFFEGILGNTD